MNAQIGLYGPFPNGSFVPPSGPPFVPPSVPPTLIEVVASLPPPPPPEKKKKTRKKASEREKSVEILCDICNIYCSSKLMYEDHCKGKKHLRREKESKVYSCDICSVFCITSDEQEEHFKSQLHEESVRVREYLKSQQPEDEESQGGSNMLTTDELNDIKLKGKLIYKTCELCKVNTNSLTMWEAHILSKKHKSREQDAAINNKKIAEQFSCSICDVLCYSANEREEHLKSEKHSDTLKERIFLGKLAAGKVVKTDEKPEEKLDDNKEEKKEQIKIEDEPMVQPVHYGENTLWYPCAICDVKMNSMENYKDHINSKNHKLKEKGFTPDKRLSSQKYKSEILRKSYQDYVRTNSSNCKDPCSFCARCDIQFKSATELETHFLDPLHKASVPKKRKTVVVPESPVFEEKRPKPNSLVNSSYGYGGRRFECTPATTPPTPAIPPPVPPPHFYFQQLPSAYPPAYPPAAYPPASYPQQNYQNTPYAVPPAASVNNYAPNTYTPAPANYAPPVNGFCAPPNAASNNFIGPHNNFMPPGNFSAPPPNFGASNPATALPLSLSLPPPPPPPEEDKPTYISKAPTRYR